MTQTAVVAFSFACRGTAGEPGPCNVRLARSVERIVESLPGSAPVVAQWEIARALESVVPALIVDPRDDGGYLDTEGVWAAAVPALRERGITAVVPVAQPWLHLAKVKKLIARDGFTVAPRRVGWIGFDRSRLNSQWWTRGPLRLVAYAMAQALTGRRGR